MESVPLYECLLIARGNLIHFSFFVYPRQKNILELHFANAWKQKGWTYGSPEGGARTRKVHRFDTRYGTGIWRYLTGSPFTDRELEICRYIG